jgi:hypothetical protein
MQGWADHGGFSNWLGMAMHAAVRRTTSFASGVVKRGIKQQTAKDKSEGAWSVADRGTSQPFARMHWHELSKPDWMT